MRGETILELVHFKQTPKEVGVRCFWKLETLTVTFKSDQVWSEISDTNKT